MILQDVSVANTGAGRALGQDAPYLSRRWDRAAYAQFAQTIVEHAMTDATLIRLDAAGRMPTK